jgi:hypothetical protein
MSTVVLIVVSSVLLGAGMGLYLWSRWTDREAGYEPEPLSEKDAATYQLGIHLGSDGTHGFHL